MTTMAFDVHNTIQYTYYTMLKQGSQSIIKIETRSFIGDMF